VAYLYCNDYYVAYVRTEMWINRTSPRFFTSLFGRSAEMSTRVGLILLLMYLCTVHNVQKYQCLQCQRDLGWEIDRLPWRGICYWNSKPSSVHAMKHWNRYITWHTGNCIVCGRHPIAALWPSSATLTWNECRVTGSLFCFLVANPNPNPSPSRDGVSVWMLPFTMREGSLSVSY